MAQNINVDNINENNLLPKTNENISKTNIPLTTTNHLFYAHQYKPSTDNQYFDDDDDDKIFDNEISYDSSSFDHHKHYNHNIENDHFSTDHIIQIENNSIVQNDDNYMLSDYLLVSRKMRDEIKHIDQQIHETYLEIKRTTYQLNKLIYMKHKADKLLLDNIKKHIRHLETKKLCRNKSNKRQVKRIDNHGSNHNKEKW
ncbi:unnamed protein product [Rotaria sordida]|uniref:Uncharacterized protein n=2 Tax=Rotaria sordida TaxID=392033 RepID=A0A815EYR3_9BILA|nr:unnamed protein product [Rotaria sordida]